MKNSYPYQPGHQTSDTSKDAAQGISKRAPILRNRCLSAITSAHNSGLTAYETAAAVGADYMSVHPRISELKRMGLVRDSGERRLNRSGKKAIV